MPYTKQDHDTVIPISAARNNNDDTDSDTQNKSSTNIGDHDDKNKKRDNISLNKYKKFDQQKREKVILWCKLAAFMLAAGTCVASFTVPALRKAVPRGLAMWQWSLLITVLLGGALISKSIVKFISLFLDREFSARENMIYYIVGLVESAWVVLWFSMILVAWLMVVDEPNYLHMPRNETAKIKKKFASTFHIVTVTLISLILGSFLWLLKELVLMVAKSSFHIRRFFDRIRITLMHQYVIDGLCAPVKNLQPLGSAEHGHGEELVVTNTGGADEQGFRVKRFGRKETFVVDVRCLDDVSQEEVSCWGMKILIKSMMNNPPLTYKVKDNNETSNRNKIDDVNEALHAADSIFESLIHDHGQQHQQYIGDDELHKHFPKEKVSDVKACLLEGADSKKIEKEVFRKWMEKAYKYRTALVRALDANKRVFQTFSKFIDVLLIFFIFALWLIILKVETRKVILFIGSAILGSAVIFGETCKKFLENILFVFWVHPFDIGDCCLIGDKPVIIEDINILVTTASTFENEMRHYPNSILAGQTISNYTRSRHMKDFIEFPLNTDTPAEKIEVLENQVKRYIKENSQYWHPEHYWVTELVNMTTMKVRLHFQHTVNYHEFRERETRKSKLLLEIKDILINKLMLKV